MSDQRVPVTLGADGESIRALGQEDRATRTLVLDPFRFRGPLTGKWIRAEHKLQAPELQRQYAEYEITGTPEIRHVMPRVGSDNLGRGGRAW